MCPGSVSVAIGDGNKQEERKHKGKKAKKICAEDCSEHTFIWHFPGAKRESKKRVGYCIDWKASVSNAKRSEESPLIIMQ